MIKRSIIFKFTIFIFILLFIVISLHSFISYNQERAILQENKMEEVIKLARIIAISSTKFIATYEFGTLEQVINDVIKKDKDIIYIHLTDEEGKVLLSDNPEIEGEYLESEIDIKAKQKAITTLEPSIQKYYDEKLKDNIYDIAVPIGSKVKLWGVVRIGYSLRSLEEALKQSLLRTLYFGSFFLIAGIIFSIFLSGGMSRPILKLAKLAEKIGTGQLDEKAKAKAKGDEINFLALSFNKMIDGLRERDLVKDTFSRYVTKDVAEKILQDIKDVGPILKGEKRKVTVLFSDMRGFTKITEDMHPEKTLELLNEYFDIMVDVVFKYEGTLDKFIGDCIMAIFGAPMSHVDDEERTIRCALEMRDKVIMFNQERKKIGMKGIVDIGTGISTGWAVVGNVGSKKRMEYTVIGDTVNIAERLTTFAKEGQIIISEDTYHEVKDTVEVIQIETEPIHVKGREEPIKIYQVMNYIPPGVYEKRRNKRREINIPIKWKMLEEEKEFLSETINISGGGMLLKIDNYLKPTTLLELQITLPKTIVKEVLGEILECYPYGGRYNIRIRYVNIPQTKQDEIIKFVYETKN